MDCLMTIRDKTGWRQWSVSEWQALTCLAVVSVDPETIEEVLDAVRRYDAEHDLAGHGDYVEEAADCVREDGLWVLIDLLSRTVVCGHDYELPDPRGCYEPCEGEEISGFPLVFLDTPGDWLLMDESENWTDLLEERCHSVEASERSAREVLYGDTLGSYLANALLSLTDDDLPQTEKDRWSLNSRIHADWLMESRDDLGGRSPREVLLADRERISCDIERRARQWSQQGGPPPALSVHSRAYRHGGMGTAEVCLYFGYVRAMLDAGWQMRAEGGRSLQELTKKLTISGEEWLDQKAEGDRRTNREIIELERRRMPLVSNGDPIDCDCPICMAEASGAFGIGFTTYDTSFLDSLDEFAFSSLESQEEWEMMAAEWDVPLVPPSGEEQVAESRTPAVHDDQSVWTSSFVSWDSDVMTESPSLLRMAIGFHLSEIVTQLKEHEDGRPAIDEVNRAYMSFARATDPVATKSTAVVLCNCLETIARNYEDLAPRSADLQSRIDEVLRRL